jgi:hypothetical protein
LGLRLDRFKIIKESLFAEEVKRKIAKGIRFAIKIPKSNPRRGVIMSTKRTIWMFVSLLVLLSMLLAGCGPKAEPKAQPAETSAPVASAGRTVGCTVESPRPTPGPTEQSVFPFPGASDWVKGPETAAITILEYSDFQ